MKLSTNKLFSSAKYPKNNKLVIKSKKPTISKIHYRQISDNIQYHNTNKYNAKLDIQKSSKNNHTASPKVNPFNDESDNFSKTKINYLKSKNFKDLKTNLEIEKNKKDILDKHMDSGDDINDFNIYNNMHTSEPDLNKKIESKCNDFELLCDLFKKNSKLKSNIIIDNCGNNNLNPEQEKFITDCFNKKEKLEKNINNCKINSIKVHNYHHNDIFLKKNKNTKRKVIRRKKQFSTCYPNTILQYFSCKNNNYKNLFGFKCIKEENEKNSKNNKDEANNSMFENCSNKSIDSSFLGSSIAEDFIQTFTETEANRANIIF